MKIEKKYWVYLFLLINISFIFAYYYFARTRLPGIDLLTWFPGRLPEDVLAMLLFPHLFVPLLGYLFGPLLVKPYNSLAKNIRLNKYSVNQYYFEKQFEGSEIIARALNASILSLSLAFSALQFLDDYTFIPDNASTSVMLLCSAFAPVAAILYNGMWLSEDCGIILYRKKAITAHGPDMQSVGSYISSLIGGYAGFSTIFLYVLLIVKTLGKTSTILPIVMLAFYPLAILGYFTTLQLWMIKNFEKIRKIQSIKLQLLPISLEFNVGQ